MKIELKRFKFYEHMSEETNAFDADLWIDGKHVGHAGNRGHGDPVNVQIRDPKTREEFEKFCAAIPPMIHDGVELKMDVDFYLANMVEDLIFKHVEEKNRKKIAKQKLKYVLFRKAGDDEYCYRTAEHGGRVDACIAHVKAKCPDCVIL